MESITKKILIILLLFSLTACKVKKTGQENSYDNTGAQITNGTLKDDGFYQYGEELSYTRDDTTGVVADNLTNLLWQDNIPSVDRSGDIAITYCSDLILANYTDWRLPTRKELHGLLYYGYNDRKTIHPIFQNVRRSYYWSSTNRSDRDDVGWVINFGSGYQRIAFKYADFYTRCVRNN